MPLRMISHADAQAETAPATVLAARAPRHGYGDANHEPLQRGATREPERTAPSMVRGTPPALAPRPGQDRKYRTASPSYAEYHGPRRRDGQRRFKCRFHRRQPEFVLPRFAARAVGRAQSRHWLDWLPRPSLKTPPLRSDGNNETWATPHVNCLAFRRSSRFDYDRSQHDGLRHRPRKDSVIRLIRWPSASRCSRAGWPVSNGRGTDGRDQSTMPESHRSAPSILTDCTNNFTRAEA